MTGSSQSIGPRAPETWDIASAALDRIAHHQDAVPRVEANAPQAATGESVRSSQWLHPLLPLPVGDFDSPHALTRPAHTRSRSGA
jgi:hypothetical protein